MVKWLASDVPNNYPTYAHHYVGKRALLHAFFFFVFFLEIKQDPLGPRLNMLSTKVSLHPKVVGDWFTPIYSSLEGHWLMANPDLFFMYIHGNSMMEG